MRATEPARAELRCLGLVLLAALLGYGAACCGVFVYDDHHSVRENVALRSLANVPRFFVDVEMFSSLDNRMYRPVLLCSFALNHALAGLAPGLFKLTNVMLHATTAGLLYGLARRLGCARSGAVLAAALFAVHPLASEAVNMVSGRSELLLVGALCAALHCHLAAMRGRPVAWIGTVTCAIVACGSKETGAILPGLLVVLEVLEMLRHGHGEVRGAIRRIAPVVLVVVVYLLVRRALLGVATLDAPAWVGASDPRTGAGRDLSTQLCTMAALLPGVLLQVLWPTGLSLDPVVTFRTSLTDPAVLFGAVVLLALTAWGLRSPRRRPVMALGTALAWATALPWVLIPLNVPLSEHRLYGPLAGLALIGAAAVGARPPAAAIAGAVARRRRRAVGLAVVLLWAGLSTVRCLDYRDEELLWQRECATNPQSYRARYSLGVCAMQAGRLEDARHWMERAIAIYPDYVSARKNLIELHLQLRERGDPVVARALAADLVERSPRNPFYLLLLSRALAAAAAASLDGGDELFDEAEARALECLEVAPPKGLVYRTAAQARRLQGRPERALALLDQALAQGLDHHSVRLDRRDVLLELGRVAEARAELERAMAVAPFDPRVLQAMSQRPAAVPN